MLKALARRLAGLLLAAVSAAPAFLAATKGLPKAFSEAFAPMFRPLWWWQWVDGWMPPIRFPWSSWRDVASSVPGLLAVVALGVGLGICCTTKPTTTSRRKWEDEG